MAKSTAFFTAEDAKTAFNLFCCVYGIGTLGMPANFSRAGPLFAIIAMAFMAFANVYASVVCSKVMLRAPRSVQTFGDLGEWCMGKIGRYLVVGAQMGVCLLVPCVFLVLGGTLLSDLFPGTFKDTTWIIVMAVTLTPICLIPTLKEGAGAAFAGCMGTLMADIIGIGVLLHGMSGHPSVPTPNVSFDQVATTFGNLSLAYGAGIVIPALQRQHSEPERMPRVIFVTLSFISVLFIALAGSGYSAVGCQIAGNLLFSIYPDVTTGMTKLGFASDRGIVVMAFLLMQLHITIAFSVILHPALYVFERGIGMHKKVERDIEAPHFSVHDTPAGSFKAGRPSKVSVILMADPEKEYASEEHDVEDYKGNEHKYIPLRIAIVAAMTVLSIILKDHFADLSDFVGASCISLSCIILPILFYFKKLWTEIPAYEKVFGLIVVVVCSILGVYVSLKTGKSLFSPEAADPDAPVFPFCHVEHQFELYYNASLGHST